jgi:hypothetical protein
MIEAVHIVQHRLGLMIGFRLNTASIASIRVRQEDADGS